MPEHINITTLIIGLAIAYGFRFIALLAFLWIMIKVQKLNYTWLPLIGATLLACALDMIPLVGHFIAVPVLYMCVWKITQCELFPDATFTVAMSYACMRCLGWIMAAYTMPDYHPTMAHNDFGDDTNFPPVAIVQTTNQVEAPETPAAPSVPPAPENKVAADISVKGISRSANDAMVTIQCGRKDYVISLGEGTTISTGDGSATVRFVEAGKNDVTLAVAGQEVKYAVK